MYAPGGGARRLLECQDKIVAFVGPAGTGKTRADLEKAYAVANKYPGSRQLLGMAERVLLSRSTLVTFEDLVVPKGSPILRGPKRPSRMEYTFANGSVIACGGMYESDRVMGTEWDRIYLFEATQCIEDDASNLITRLRWGHTAYHQLVIECNPDAPGHWIKRWIDENRCTHIESRHEDNPKWFTPGVGWTPEGRDYVLGTLEPPALMGYKYKRLRLGLWVAADGGVFNADALAAHRETFGTDPYFRGNLVAKHEGQRRELALIRREVDAVEWVEAEGDALARSTWKLWTNLIEDERGRLRPPQDANYVFMADVSQGNGASNSVIAVGDADRRCKVAEFASATVEPSELARIMVEAAAWFGGRAEVEVPMVGWEANGPGVTVGQFVVGRYAWPRVYRDVRRITGRDETTDHAGWTSDPGSKRALAEALNDAYVSGSWINPSKASIDEAMGWVFYPSLGLGPARLERESQHARATHGDRVIADMMLVHAMDHAPFVKPPERDIPIGSPAWYDRRDARARKVASGEIIEPEQMGW